ncbi:hypothetical protein BT96DRAFT_1093186 [Gymnopus androsaceus JB14]|uniref:Uncharacterized protein n=1 Tax=Gymnopus androsaceus JB14 TaxID=1447944 RepID=A0A6A4GIA0_9AGAR|nr:hypothetical protein BT96DRAFT_1093186 [Gymnopus androsaceus JB14]
MVHNCVAEKFNEDSVNTTLDCCDNTPCTATQDVGLPLKSLYGILQDKFEELVFSKPYCIEVGPLLLFLRKKVICECLSNAEKPNKEKVGKEKAGKSIQDSMVMENPTVHIPGQQPDVVIAKVVLHSIFNKLYLPINWFTNVCLKHIQHHMHELHTKLIHPESLVEVPKPDKVMVFNMSKMITLWGLDELYTCLSPVKWKQATKNLLAALLLLSESLSPAKLLTRHTFAEEFRKHQKFSLNMLTMRRITNIGICLSVRHAMTY